MNNGSEYVGASPKPNTNPPYSGDSFGVLLIGATHGIENYYWGKIDDLYLFDRILTEPEIEGLYSEGLY